MKSRSYSTLLGFWAGAFTTAALEILYMDWLGRDEYAALIMNSWVDWHISAIMAMTLIVLAAVLTTIGGYGSDGR